MHRPLVTLAALAALAPVALVACSVEPEPDEGTEAQSAAWEQDFSRCDVLVRAKAWDDAVVAYSSTSAGAVTYPDRLAPWSGPRVDPAPWTSYRKDCSGFVSFVWGIWPEKNTLGMIKELASPTFEDLTPGDAFVWDAGSAGQNAHVMLFVGWASPGRAVVRDQGGLTGSGPEQIVPVAEAACGPTTTYGQSPHCVNVFSQNHKIVRSPKGACAATSLEVGVAADGKSYANFRNAHRPVRHKLGVPKTPVVVFEAPSGRSGIRPWLQDFHRGTEGSGASAIVARDGTSAAHVVLGGFYSAWVERGGVAGRCGLPTSGEVASGGGVRQTFEGCTMTYAPAAGLRVDVR